MAITKGELIEKLNNSSDFQAETIYEETRKEAPELLKDREVAETFLTKDGNLLKHFTDFGNERDLVMKAVENDGNAYRYAYQFKTDVEVFKTAVENSNKDMMDLAPLSIRDNDECALLSVSKVGDSWHHISDRLKKEKSLVLQAVKSDPMMYWWDLKPKYKTRDDIDWTKDKDVAFVACIRYSGNISSVPENIRGVVQDMCHQCESFDRGYDVDDTLKSFKMKDINKEYFANDDFYNRVVEATKEKFMAAYNKATAGLKEKDIIEAELEKDIKERLATIEYQLKLQRQTALEKRSETLKKIDNAKNAIQEFEV